MNEVKLLVFLAGLMLFGIIAAILGELARRKEDREAAERRRRIADHPMPFTRE